MNGLSELVRRSREAGLDGLLIGGNALRLLGYLRNTIDVDFLVPARDRAAWQTFLEGEGYRLFHATDAFAQFDDTAGIRRMPVDLMFVDDPTWARLREAAREHFSGDLVVNVPLPEHLVALKLHAASSTYRSRSAQDWEDIRQLVKNCGLDPKTPLFRELILRYGGEAALRRIEAFRDGRDGRDSPESHEDRPD